MRPSSPLDHYKKQATALQEYLEAGGAPLKRAHALEAIARIHGFDDFHTLSFVETRSANFRGTEDVTKYVRKNRDIFELQTEDVILALNSPSGLYAAVRSGGEVNAVYLHETQFGTYKAYDEGDAFASQCPARILSLLSPTDDPNCLVWREAGWIHALRERIAEMSEEEDIVSPWRLLSMYSEVDGYWPRYAARVAAKSGCYAFSNGKTARNAMRSYEQVENATYLDLATENPLNSVEHALRPGTPWRWIQLGEAPFRVWVLVSKDGGFYSWTANPFHLESSKLALTPHGLNLLEDEGDDGEEIEPFDELVTGRHDGTKAVLEMAARGPLNKGAGTFDLLLERVLAGQFDPTL